MRNIVDRSVGVKSDPPPAFRCAGIILAAGASTRMGTNKMLLRVSGIPMVKLAVKKALAAGLSPVTVVLGYEAQLMRKALHDVDCYFTESSKFEGPTSGSLHAGLRAIGHDADAAVIMLGDMIHTTPIMIRALVDSARNSDAPLCVSRYDGVLAPPLLFRRSLWPELLAWQGEGCGKAVVKAHQHEAIMHDWPVDALKDVDTPEDYAAAIQVP
jgi:molybdenum cofactor cytidylyltransferase